MKKMTRKFTVCAAFTVLGIGIAPLSHAGYTLAWTSGGYAINNLGQLLGTNAAGNSVNLTGNTTTEIAGMRSANGFNDNGQVIGNTIAANGARKAILWNGTALVDLVVPSGFYATYATAISNSGQIAGFANGIGTHATRWNASTGAAMDLGTLGGPMSAGYAINNSGQVAGWSYTSKFVEHATVWNGTTATDLGTLGGWGSWATTINDAGLAAGMSDTAAGCRHATLWSSTGAKDLDTSGGCLSSVGAMNNAGQMVGWGDISLQGYNDPHAMLWDGTSATDLNSLLDVATINAGWVLTHAGDISDSGVIIGSALNKTSWERRSFLFAPVTATVSTVPEPETGALLLVGLGLLYWTTRRRSKDAA